MLRFKVKIPDGRKLKKYLVVRYSGSDIQEMCQKHALQSHGKPRKIIASVLMIAPRSNQQRKGVFVQTKPYSS